MWDNYTKRIGGGGGGGGASYRIDYRSVSETLWVSVLLTYDPHGLARFLWLWPGTLRFQKWYVPCRIAFQNALLLMWMGLFSWLLLEMKSRYHSLGVKARFLSSNRHKYGAYRSGTVWTVQLWASPVQFDFPEYYSYCIRSISEPDQESIR